MAIREHGEANFIIGELKPYATAWLALQGEISFIENLNPAYNSTPGGDGAFVLTKEGRMRQRESAKQRLSGWLERSGRGPAKLARSVMCLDDGMEFASASEAARYYGASKSAVIEVCGRNPRRATASGKVFRYIGDIEKNVDAVLAAAHRRTEERPYKAAKKLAKPIICINDGRQFPSAIEASAAYGFHRSYIGEVCRGIKNSCGGLKFKYLEVEALH